MKIRLLAFAGVREILGGSERQLELPDGADLAELRRVLEREHPELGPYWDRLALAVDGRLGAGDAALADGSEVALLPPVSGGEDGEPVTEVTGPPNGPHNGLVDGPVDVGAVVERVRARGRGAVLTFEGCVRDHHEGRRVTHLVYDAYRPMATAALVTIAREVEADDDGLVVEIVHRLGEVPAGETSVVIAVASPHRDAAYAASRLCLERLKHEVPVWKREHYADGEAVWREEEPLTAVPEVVGDES